MNNTQAPPTQEPKIKTRVLASLISAGRLGKSTVFGDGIIPWLDFAQVPWMAIDGDDVHRTLSQRHPTKIKLTPVKDEATFLMVWKHSGNAPVEICDLPAQQTPMFLNTFAKYSIVEVLARKGIRLTLFLFATHDDIAALQSAGMLAKFFGTNVDYVIVENPAVRPVGDFYQSPLAAHLLDRLAAKRLQLPAIDLFTMKEIHELSKKAQRWLSFQDAKNELSDFAETAIEYFQNRIMVQCEDLADLLLPDVSLIKNRCVRTSGVKEFFGNDTDWSLIV